MTRCKEFYEKLEKDGNFCGMRDKDYSQAVSFWKDVEKDKDAKPSKSCDAWVRDERKQAASHKLVEAEEPEEPKRRKLWSKTEQSDYAAEVVRTFIANGVDPAVIRELIVKAIGVVEQE